MEPDSHGRRRFLRVVAAAPALLWAGRRASGSEPATFWEGTAMGSYARIELSGADEDAARRAIALCIAEVERLERALSLFRDDSELVALNRTGRSSRPSQDFSAAISLSLAVAAATGGLFDPTVQALWELYAAHFAERPDQRLPEGEIEAALRNVDWSGVTCDARGITLRDGLRITLNGLGQGYVTDRVGDLLRERGWRNVLVDLGELRALGPRQGARPWRVTLPGGETIGLWDGAVATSMASGCVFGDGGTAHHLFDPRSGLSARLWTSVTVFHPRAALADALSTALSCATAEEIRAVLRCFPEATVWAVTHSGRQLTITA